MGAAGRLSAVIGVTWLALTVASPVRAQVFPPPPAGGERPPFGLPGSAPPHFSKGKGMGPGKVAVDVTYNCLGVLEAVTDRGSPFSYIEDAVEVQYGGSAVYLEGIAAGDLAGEGLAVPTQGAAASLETQTLSLQPFDFCASSAGSVLDAVVEGTHVDDPEATGVADVEFQFEYQATLELKGSGGRFAAHTGTELEILGVSLDSFEVSADGEVVDVPRGLSVTEKSVGAHRVYEISGTYVIEGELRYGPGVRNVVRTTFFAGSEVEGLQIGRTSIIAGFAAAKALDTISYQVVSLDPAVVFTFIEASAPEEVSTP